MENLQTLLVNNEPDQIELRRSRNTLRIVGSGIIIFSAWAAIKTMALLFLLRQETIDVLRKDYELTADISDGVAFWVTTIMTFIILAVIVAIRAYIGMSAISEGRGKRKGIVYLLLAVIMIVFNSMSLVTGVSRLGVTEQQGAFTENQTISALIIDATSTIMIVEMVVASIKVKMLTRKKRSGGK